MKRTSKLNINRVDKYQKKEYFIMEIELKNLLTEARKSVNMTQKELAERSGVRQSNISRIESGNCSATVSTLECLADGMGKKLVIRFE